MAQLVSRQQLFELAGSSGKVQEEDSGSNDVFSYQDFLKWHDECIEDAKRMQCKDPLEFAYDKVKETYLESKCPPIKFAGQGSSRAAFALAGGKCLKIATSKRGIAQNRQEMKNSIDEKSCFTRIYANSESFSSLLTECCAEAQLSDFRKLLGISIKDVCDAFRLIIEYDGPKIAIKALEKNHTIHLAYMQAKADFLRKIMNASTPQEKVFSDLLKLYQACGWRDDELLIDDLEEPDNWGLAIRDGQICLVIIDSGFSDSVFNAYYA